MSLPIGVRPRAAILVAGAAVVVAVASCGSDHGTGPTSSIAVASLTIDSPAVQLERGTHKFFSATAKDSDGKPVDVPIVWHSSVDSIAAFQPDGRLLAHDTGVAAITASTVGGIVSAPVGVHVVWLGAAHSAAFNWTQPNAVTPSSTPGDSIRVSVTNRAGGPAAGARVLFTVTAGGGKVSASLDTTDKNGVASTQWTLGPNLGKNTVLAVTVDDDGKPMDWVTPDTVTFSVTAFNPLLVVAGDTQTAQLLSPLPVNPSVKLVDSTGKPRPGVPITFIPTGGGSVALPVVSTGADGIASPGVWTLGDVPAKQSLLVKVESAVLTLHATGTGTPIHFKPASVTAGGFATCALGSDALVSCWGLGPLIGAGDTVTRPAPTPTQGGIQFASVTGSPSQISHFCGVSTDQSIYCWGFNALVDTLGHSLNTTAPTKLPSDVIWSHVSPGFAHNCALSLDLTPYCWGANGNGQLGDRDTVTHFAPVQVAGGFKFTVLSSGTAHTCGLTADHAAFCWGFNGAGQLGDGTTTDRVVPTAVSGNLAFSAIGAGEALTCGLTTDGKIDCWGNVNGVVQTAPTEVTGGPALASLSVGGGHACGLTSDGNAYCWGNNNVGQLGDSTTTTRTNPVPVAGGLKFSSISAGYAHTCGITLDGSVACWGLNRSDELGDSTATFRLTPKFIVLGITP